MFYTYSYPIVTNSLLSNLQSCLFALGAATVNGFKTGLIGIEYVLKVIDIMKETNNTNKEVNYFIEFLKALLQPTTTNLLIEIVLRRKSRAEVPSPLAIIYLRIIHIVLFSH